MMRSLYTAAAGMAAQQFNIDTISNNIANVNTAGFRTNQARFQDLIYQQLRAAGTPVGSSVVPVAQEVGLGVKIASSEKIFTQGTIQQTNNPLDVAIEGDGFFQVTKPDGTTAYTRDGSFKRDANGSLVTADGYFISPQVTIPQSALEVGVGSDGAVTAVLPGQSAPQTLGQIQIARFTNAAGLAPTGQNLFTQTGASGAPCLIVLVSISCITRYTATARSGGSGRAVPVTVARMSTPATRTSSSSRSRSPVRVSTSPGSPGRPGRGR